MARPPPPPRIDPAMGHTMDEAVGRILATLEANGQGGRTVVISTSDNGGYGPVTHMDPLRGCKGTSYEGGIRVPLGVRWPGVAAAGTRNATPVHQVDLFQLASAPGETRDRALADPARRDALLDELRAWIAATRAPLAAQPDPQYDAAVKPP